jgi:5'(3')-deoxyribonucleotidase
MLNSLRKKYILLLSLILLTSNQNKVLSQQKNRLYFEVKSSVNSFYKTGDKLFNKANIETYNNSYIDLYLKPYNSVRIQVYSCTNLIIDNLARFNDGILVSIDYKNIVFCPTKSKIRITSTLVDKDSKIKGKFKQRKVLFEGTDILVSENIDNNILIGTSNGKINIEYINKATVKENYYIESKDNNHLPLPKLAPEPYLESVARLTNNLNRVCTNENNLIESQLGNKPFKLNNKLCLDTTINDKIKVFNPTGKGLDSFWVFDEYYYKKDENNGK